MTLKEMIEQTLDPKTVQMNIDFLKKVGEKMSGDDKNKMDAIIAGMKLPKKEPEKAKQPLSQIPTNAQPASTQETAQTTETSKTAQSAL